MNDWLYDLGRATDPWVLGLLAAVVVLCLLVVILWVNLLAFKRKFKTLMRGVNGDNLESLLEKHIKAVATHQQIAEEHRNTMNQLQEKLRCCVQHVGVKRYNAFDDVGSRLSYSVALLNDHLDGMVMTGIYGRHESTTYAKIIHHGHSEQHLSVEEMDALQMAKEQQRRDAP